MEAKGALKRKLSDVVFRQMMTDARAARPAGVVDITPGASRNSIHLEDSWPGPGRLNGS